MECTRTALNDHHLLCFVAATTAHQIATIHPDRCIVALTTVRSLYAQAQILLAEARRLFQIDNVLGTRCLVLGIVWLEDELIAVSTKKEKS